MQMLILTQTLMKLNLGRLVNLDTNINFIGKDALQKINNDGIKRKQIGMLF